MHKNILICGVGGQGTVLASRLLASSALSQGEEVHSAETIGMAQRGGSVTSHLRIGDKIFSPLIPQGKADLILAFEPAEAVRNLPYLKKDGLIILNSRPVKPVTESLRSTGYNGQEMIGFLQDQGVKICVADAEEICAPLGSPKFFNVAILGVACGMGALGISPEIILGEIESKVKKSFVEKNKVAFASGLELGRNYAA